MRNHEWRNRLQRELIQTKLPSAYSARLVEELTDHLTDMERKETSMDALSIEQKLGTPKALATAAEREYLKRTFAGRHPIVVFGLLPIPIAIVMLVTITLLFVVPSESLSEMIKTRITGDLSTNLSQLICYFNLYLLRLLPFALTSLLFVRMGQRVGLPNAGLAACGCVACFAFIFRAVVIPQSIKGDFQMRIGICFESGLHQWQYGLLQMIAPLAIGFLANRTQVNWTNSSGRTALLICLFPALCAIPLPTPIGKLVAIAVLGILMLTAIVGMLWCAAIDRFGMRLMRV